MRIEIDRKMRDKMLKGWFYMRVHELLTEIEKSRKEMVSLASQHSFSHQQVVEASTKLDHLLNKYYLLIKK